MLFMAMVMPVTIQGLIVANRAGIVAERKRVATRLAELKLGELTATDDWLLGSGSGDFGDDYPDFRWSTTSEGWLENEVDVVTVEVRFEAQGGTYSVIVSTLADQEAVAETS